MTTILVVLMSLVAICYTQELVVEDRPLNILLLNGLFAGHLFPLVSLGEELVSRGHNVSLCSTVMEGSRLLPSLPESVGIKFLNAGLDVITLEEFEAQTRNQKDGPGGAAVADFATVAHQSAVKILNKLETYGIERFDMIVCDFSVIPIGLHYAILGRKVIAFSSMLPPYPAIESPWPLPFTLSGGQSDDLSFLERLQNSILAPLLIPAWNYVIWIICKGDERLETTLNGINFMRYPGINIPHLITSVIGFDTPALQTPLRHYVGPMVKKRTDKLAEDLEEWLSNKRERSVIYISMGTTGYVSGDVARAIIESVMATKFDAVWALRDNNRGSIEGVEIDDNRIFISGWVSQQTILAHASIRLCILHCGLNSVQESLYNGLPVVCLPHAFDHFATGGTIRNIRVGISMYSFFDSILGHTNVSAKDLTNAITTVSSDEYVANARRVSLMYKFAGGAETAAGLVEYYTDVGYDHLIPAFARYQWSWIQYRNLDVCVVLFSILAVFTFLLYKCLYSCVYVKACRK